MTVTKLQVVTHSSAHAFYHFSTTLLSNATGVVVTDALPTGIHL
jgi:hypothetical protein